MMVQHFAETSGQHNDSTGNANNSTTVSVTQQGAEGAQMGRMDEFTQASSTKVWMNDAASLRPTGDMTIEAWTKLKRYLPYWEKIQPFPINLPVADRPPVIRFLLGQAIINQVLLEQ